MYSIVIFEQENAVEGVPSKWISQVAKENFCFWPSKLSRDKVAKLIKTNSDYSANWTLLKCRVKCKAKSYDDMKIKAKEAEILSSQAEASEVETDFMDVGVENAHENLCPTPSPPRKKRRG